MLYIASYRSAQEIESQEYDKNQWFLHALIRLIQITQHGGFHSVAYGGHLHLVCVVCDVAI